MGQEYDVVVVGRGSADEPLAVVDPELRIHGIERMRVVDLAVLPVAPRRRTATAAVGEARAEFLGARRCGTAG